MAEFGFGENAFTLSSKDVKLQTPRPEENQGLTGEITCSFCDKCEKDWSDMITSHLKVYWSSLSTWKVLCEAHSADS